MAGQCRRLGLVDEILVYVLPVLLGDGIRFYSSPGLARIDRPGTGQQHAVGRRHHPPVPYSTGEPSLEAAPQIGPAYPPQRQRCRQGRYRLVRSASGAQAAKRPAEDVKRSDVPTRLR